MRALFTVGFWRMRELTGLHVLTFALAFFGIIIAVNISMAIFATTSWTGLIAKNGYVASIDYAAKEKALDRLAASGLGVAIAVTKGKLAIALEGANAATPVSAQALNGTDEPVDLFLTGRGDGVYEAPLALSPGHWTMAVTIGEAGSDVTVREPFFVDARMSAPEAAAR